MIEMKWSYKTVHFELKREGLLGSSFLDETEVEQQLNDYGRSGWELTSVIEVQDGIIAFFKQPLDLGLSSRIAEAAEAEQDKIHATDEVLEVEEHKVLEADEVHDSEDIDDAAAAHQSDDVYGSDAVYESEDMYETDEVPVESEYSEQRFYDQQEDEFRDRQGGAERSQSFEDDGHNEFIEDEAEQDQDPYGSDEEEEAPDQRGIGAIRIE